MVGEWAREDWLLLFSFLNVDRDTRVKASAAEDFFFLFGSTRRWLIRAALLVLYVSYVGGSAVITGAHNVAQAESIQRHGRPTKVEPPCN